MSEQRLLFELETRAWVDRLWRTMDSDMRLRIVAILVEMGRRALVRRPVNSKGETTDES